MLPDGFIKAIVKLINNSAETPKIYALDGIDAKTINIAEKPMPVAVVSQNSFNPLSENNSTAGRIGTVTINIRLYTDNKFDVEGSEANTVLLDNAFEALQDIVIGEHRASPYLILSPVQFEGGARTGSQNLGNNQWIKYADFIYSSIIRF